MKIRHPFLIKCIGFVGAWIVRLWVSSLRYRFKMQGGDIRPLNPSVVQPRYIYAFWHEYLLPLAYHYAQPDVLVLISQHADGQMIAEVCRHLGFGLVRGSTTRGGAEAVRRMVREAGNVHLAITPDGPRGPRRKIQQGLIYLASRTGLPIVVAGIGYKHAWRAKSWDRFALPWPFTRTVVISSEPMFIPAELSDEEFDACLHRVESRLSELTALAEERAVHGAANLEASANDGKLG